MYLALWQNSKHKYKSSIYKAFWASLSYATKLTWIHMKLINLNFKQKKKAKN